MVSHDSHVYQLFEDLRTSLSHLMLTDKESSSPTGTTTTVKQTTPKQVNLPKLALPTFHGDPMKWFMFWEKFQAVVHINDNLQSAHKLTYLRKTLRDPMTSPLLQQFIFSYSIW